MEVDLGGIQLSAALVNLSWKPLGTYSFLVHQLGRLGCIAVPCGGCLRLFILIHRYASWLGSMHYRLIGALKPGVWPFSLSSGQYG